MYRHDAVWPTVALKKLVGNTVKVTQDDLQKGYEANYGERVRCLAIVLNDQHRAEQVFEMARKDNTSKYFGDLAAQYSVEPGSQALRARCRRSEGTAASPSSKERLSNCNQTSYPA